MKINKNNRTKIIKARVTDEEQILVKTKAKYYGYKNLSKYLIDAAVYEKVTYVDLDNQQVIYDAYAKNTEELRKITKEIRRITKYATELDNITIQTVTSLMFTILSKQKDMLKLIDKKLNLKVWQEINHKKQMQEE